MNNRRCVVVPFYRSGTAHV